ncbi:tRNA (5-methylaminomethyl-2-thiouridine)(34)-methyltransferase MnmD [Salegentibacter sp. F188]|uniref:tRNA (5-methylaminomethyl-2-thiouridine)(34)-methyltransferase MnmD n=1 Tax=Autumnicola patrickiae TaxID=3075591 RepID=A0ABU3E0V9_9FLAO|nr:tRNA (5-methylaminomethyl-2-thiouridine)(34)-methyltransferase MnmD [Salegentibacter sp. F188]MDT0689533.1 tRNA (5-methylaminomethyl-2-thiouridine)(34)-methyltransferase MnmD [Salegentibacter sp. F188]
MERKIITTGDGSVTIHLPQWNEQYHSKHGAVQEAQHVFIEMGLNYYVEQNNFKNIRILEIGFGTGLNAFITFLQLERIQKKINYTGVEAFPVEASEIEKLNYAEVLSAEDKKAVLLEMHKRSWEEETAISENFLLKKQKKKFEDISEKNTWHLIYFDAFGARVQPELWTEDVFKKMFEALLPGGVLVTYAAKGSVRRAMQAVGFTVERLPGPPGKREMLRAVKKHI